MEARRVQGVAVRLSWKCSGSTTGWAPALPDHSSILRLHAPDGCQSLLQVHTTHTHTEGARRSHRGEAGGGRL